ncbi:hypothetical protein BJY01DRAFT_255522 [Aspergillus pseudoustus]|uniref:Zn(2)-C6 fungal-type domain-containing protein n=1 Tax=Aspergillus pseudoustus TaxID=1810923 RepID=A0ABR4IJE4_9EURO
MSSDFLAKQRRRRDKLQLSCNPCRKRKVRCDRNAPCKTCVGRGEQTDCIYALHSSPAPRRSKSNHAHKRGRPDLAGLGRDINSSSILAGGTSVGRLPESRARPNLLNADPWADIVDILPGGQRTGVERSSHWPELLLGLRDGTTLRGLLMSVPSKGEVDRLISKYFNSLDLAVWVSHGPTFQEEYECFWKDPTSVTANWLSILFSMMCLATDLMLQSGEPLPLKEAEQQDPVSVFRKCSAQCLMLGDYTRPTTYTVDALLLYSYTELLQLHDTDFGLHIVLTTMIRVAMKMGYHRDPSHDLNISIFAGEMRRRLWGLLVQLDTLVSLQVGLPRMINEQNCDTQAPRNIPMEEMDRKMTSLPPSRPESGSSPGSYMRSRTRLVSVLGQIHDHLSLAQPLSYDTVIQLHEMLDAQHEALPTGLKIRKVPLVTGSSAAVMRCLSLDLLYQKARCVLHRRYMTPQNRLSWETCIDAALTIIRHQTYVYHETRPGGLLSGHLWKITYLATYDFLLGSMLLYLGLQSRARTELGLNLKPNCQTAMQKALEDSYTIWTAWYTEVKGSKQILDAVKTMLDQATPGALKLSPRKDFQQPGASIIANNPSGLGLGNHGIPVPFTPPPTESQTVELRALTPSLPCNVAETSPSSSGFVDPMDGFDWASWDNHLQENGIYSQLSSRDMVF